MCFTFNWTEFSRKEEPSHIGIEPRKRGLKFCSSIRLNVKKNFKFNFCKIGSEKNFEFLAGDGRAVVEFKTTHNSIFQNVGWFLSAKLNPNNTH